MKHDHAHCRHAKLEYCDHCNVVWCHDCQAEFAPKTATWWGTTYTYGSSVGNQLIDQLIDKQLGYKSMTTDNTGHTHGG